MNFRCLLDYFMSHSPKGKETLSSWGHKKPSHEDEIKQIKKLLKEIMATQKEAVESLNEIKTVLVEVSSGIDKVSTEQDTTLAKILELEAIVKGMGGDASVELVQGIADLKALALGVQSKIKAVDDKIPDGLPQPS